MRCVPERLDIMVCAVLRSQRNAGFRDGRVAAIMPTFISILQGLLVWVGG